MIIKRIRLNNFRNYGRLDVDVGPSVNIVYGDNGKGKTNLIESIYVASCATSHKTSKDKNLVMFGSDGFEIIINAEDDDGTLFEFKNNVVIKGDIPKRYLYCNNEHMNRISDYLGICNTVIFAPEDLEIIKGAPAERRKFINLLISKVSPSYFNLLGNVNRVISQKNEILKDARRNPEGIETKLDYWDFSLSDLSAELIIYRYRFIDILNDVASQYHLSISGGTERLELKYMTISGCIELIEAFLAEHGITDEYKNRGLNRGDFEALKAILSSHILNKFKSVRKYDIEKGISSIGIKKDDIDICLNERSTRVYSSQGQQRSAALSLKLAELEILKRFVCSTPILLLDDVFSELDVQRRVSLISAIKGTQIFITCTDRNYIESEIGTLIDENTDVRYLHVTGDGNIEQ
ncbi:DNA replication and repair protein RecF [Ruminococcaceae bacterium YRB3002]|nr:DNA replication and repair protein RecF [Ruminococcaceae bacterium YRB3002]